VINDINIAKLQKRYIIYNPSFTADGGIVNSVPVYCRILYAIVSQYQLHIYVNVVASSNSVQPKL